MDLSEKTNENIQYMIGKIVEKLRMANVDALRPKDMNLEVYDDLKDIYDMVMKKDTFSPYEMQALAEELGKLRNS